ncbi:MAG: cysteine-rich CWC family protein [Bacteroidetes bacterium]|nr:cysteine-rich CWC family protein [Bacteroidota bacterium]
MSIKICSKCSRSFECQNESMGCWCEELFLSINTLNEIKQQYDNCLCPTCLKEFADRDKK